MAKTPNSLFVQISHGCLIVANVPISYRISVKTETIGSPWLSLGPWRRYFQPLRETSSHCKKRGIVTTEIMIPNVLSQRYASKSMNEIWSSEGRILLERRFWIAVMKAQLDLGLQIPKDAIIAYENAAKNIDPDSIADRERVTRHDVKARIEEFNSLAGREESTRE